MDYDLLVYLCVAAIWLYFPSQFLLEGIGYKKSLERQRIYWEFIRLINCLFPPASLVVLYQYIFGEWSVFAGWNLITETDFAKEAIQVVRGIVATLLVLVVPLASFIFSISVFFYSYKKIKNPRENIFTKDDY
tara:strand:- start:368 stop:766 length:399 start_codon:yes stop_codon:yes gene_type:complete